MTFVFDLGTLLGLYMLQEIMMWMRIGFAVLNPVALITVLKSFLDMFGKQRGSNGV